MHNIAKKRIYTRFLSFVIVCCVCSFSVSRVLANDYPLISDWAQDEALLAEQQGLLPQERLYGDLREEGSRAQAVRYLVHLTEVLLQKNIPNTSKGIFSDLDGVWNKTVEAAEKAYSAGIVLGYDNNCFCPADAITREEYATMLFRLLQYVENDKKVQLLPEDQDNNVFVDGASISPWAEDAVNTLSSIGVFRGQADGAFNPGGHVSLEQIIVVSYRCWKYCTG